jgi:ribosomal protein S12 methylthiotransferase accessory factor
MSISYRGRPLDTKKTYWEGTHRAISPAATLKAITPHFPRFGISRNANITHLDKIGIPTTLSIRPNSGTLSVCSGKGFTLEAALVSGAMESIELFHAEHVSLPTIRMSYADLTEQYAVIPRGDLLLTKYSLFNEDWRYHWTLGWDLITQSEIAVPIASVEMVRSKRRITELGAFQVTSNGLASGNTLSEAICGAILEVVERDATSCVRVAWQHTGNPPPLVDLARIRDARVLALLEQLRAADIATTLFDCTIDTKIPVYMAFIHDVHVRGVGLYKGYGAHLDPNIAMIRALTEAVQARVIYIAGSRDDFFRQEFNRLKRADNEAALDSIAGLSPAADWPDSRSAPVNESFGEDICYMIRQLRSVGVEHVIVMDLTVEDLPVSVVKVVIPKLEGYMFDFYTPGGRARAYSGMVTT